MYAFRVGPVSTNDKFTEGSKSGSIEPTLRKDSRAFCCGRAFLPRAIFRFLPGENLPDLVIFSLDLGLNNAILLAFRILSVCCGVVAGTAACFLGAFCESKILNV